MIYLRKKPLWGLGLLLLIAVLVVSGYLFRPAARFQRDHGFVLPSSVQKIQRCQEGKLLDRGILSIFQIDSSDEEVLLSSLQIREKHEAVAREGHFLEGGYRVWPKEAKTFVPGSFPMNEFQKTWSGTECPGTMYSCLSSTGDWLHLEIWTCGPERWVKVYTDWN